MTPGEQAAAVDMALAVIAAYPPWQDERGVYHCAFGQMMAAELRLREERHGTADDDPGQDEPGGTG